MANLSLPLPSVPLPIPTSHHPPLSPSFHSVLLVFRGGARKQGECGGDQPDGGGQGSASQPQLECRLPHRQWRPLWALHHPHQPHHQWGHADSGQGKKKATHQAYSNVWFCLFQNKTLFRNIVHYSTLHLQAACLLLLWDASMLIWVSHCPHWIICNFSNWSTITANRAISCTYFYRSSFSLSLLPPAPSAPF